MNNICVVKPTKRGKRKGQVVVLNDTDSTNDAPIPPLIFISHDSRDADLAEDFAELLTDASGGMLKSFRSSDKSGTQGIEFGTEWYRAIMQKLDEATDVVALLTERSLNRPWILYETGVAKGKLDGTVLGLALGVSLEKAATGPFAQFQNSGEDEDSITKLVLQLIRRNPNATPREEAVRRQVKVFKQQVAEVLKSRHESPPADVQRADDNSVARLFEEIKLQIRGMSQNISQHLQILSMEITTTQREITTGTRPFQPPNDSGAISSVTFTAGGKPVRVRFAGSWKSAMRNFALPNGSNELCDEVIKWFDEDPNRLTKRSQIVLRLGRGTVIPRPDGVLLNNFRSLTEVPDAND